MEETTHIHKSFQMRRYDFLFAVGIMLLVCGCLIYAIWRSRDTNLCRWADGIGLGFILDFLRSAFGMINPGDFVRYNLADALYCIAYILIMNHIWHGHRIWVRILVVSLIPVAAIIHETLQGLGFASGTFDPLDLLCYVCPYAAYLLSISYEKTQSIIHCFIFKSTAT